MYALYIVDIFFGFIVRMNGLPLPPAPCPLLATTPTPLAAQPVTSFEVVRSPVAAGCTLCTLHLHDCPICVCLPSYEIVQNAAAYCRVKVGCLFAEPQGKVG